MYFKSKLTRSFKLMILNIRKGMMDKHKYCIMDSANRIVTLLHLILLFSKEDSRKGNDVDQNGYLASSLWVSYK